MCCGTDVYNFPSPLSSQLIDGITEDEALSPAFQSSFSGSISYASVLFLVDGTVCMANSVLSTSAYLLTAADCFRYIN